MFVSSVFEHVCMLMLAIKLSLLLVNWEAIARYTERSTRIK